MKKETVEEFLARGGRIKKVERASWQEILKKEIDPETPHYKQEEIADAQAKRRTRMAEMKENNKD